jgi:hypothetical protein
LRAAEVTAKRFDGFLEGRRRLLRRRLLRALHDEASFCLAWREMPVGHVMNKPSDAAAAAAI